MKHLIATFVFVFALVVVGSGEGQTGKKPQLPKGWSKLGLSAEQKAGAYKLLTEFQAGKADLLARLKALEMKRDEDLLKLLTDAQKKQLRELLLKGLPDDKKPDDKK
jgi:hypothetical protein